MAIQLSGGEYLVVKLIDRRSKEFAIRLRLFFVLHGIGYSKEAMFTVIMNSRRSTELSSIDLTLGLQISRMPR